MNAIPTSTSTVIPSTGGSDTSSTVIWAVGGSGIGIILIVIIVIIGMVLMRGGSLENERNPIRKMIMSKMSFGFNSMVALTGHSVQGSTSGINDVENSLSSSSNQLNQSTITINKNRYLDRFKLQATLMLDTLAFTKTSDAHIIALPGHLEIQFDKAISIKNERAGGAAGEIFTAEFIDTDPAFNSIFKPNEPRIVAVKLFKGNSFFFIHHFICILYDYIFELILMTY